MIRYGVEVVNSPLHLSVSKATGGTTLTHNGQHWQLRPCPPAPQSLQCVLHAALALHMQERVEVHRAMPSVDTARVWLWGAAEVGAGVAAPAGH